MTKTKFGVKKLVIGLSMLILGVTTSLTAVAQEDIMTITKDAGYTVAEKYRPKASIVIDSQTGQVVWEENPDVQRPIASITKLMTIYLALEAMEQGHFSLDTVLQPSQQIINISNIYSLSNNKMMLGADYTIADILHLVIIPSSNAATVMLANQTSNNDEALFIKMMNDKAKELGMTNTIYYNATGATSASFEGNYLPKGIDPNGDNLSTARDLSILVYNIIANYPQLLEFTNKAAYTVHPGQPSEESFKTYLFSLPGAKYASEGVDGLKTGSSPSAGFGYTATAKRGDTRLIEIILGVGDWDDQLGEEERHPIGNALLDKMFAEYEYKKVLAKGKQIVNQEEIILADDLYGFVAKNQEVTFTLTNNQVSVQSSLAQVSPLISAKSVAYEVTTKKSENVNSFNPTKKQENKEKVPESLLMAVRKYAIGGLLIIFGLIVILLGLLFNQPRQGNRQHPARRKSGKMNTVFGFSLIGAGLILSLLSYLGTFSF